MRNKETPGPFQYKPHTVTGLQLKVSVRNYSLVFRMYRCLPGCIVYMSEFSGNEIGFRRLNILTSSY